VPSTTQALASNSCSRPRVISLAPHITEQLSASRRRTAARLNLPTILSPHSAFPVGRAHSVDLERIARLKPDLIVIWAAAFHQAPWTQRRLARRRQRTSCTRRRRIVDAAPRRTHRP
jgi:hypothetical protein